MRDLDMDDRQFAEMAASIASAGLAGEAETAMVAGFCERLRSFGIPLVRASVFIDTLHPTYEGRIFSWQASGQQTKLTEYERTGDEGALAERWRRSPFYHLLETGGTALRRRLDETGDVASGAFPILADLKAQGMTEYLAMINRFAAERTIGDMDCVYSSWVTDSAQGFRDSDVAALKRLMPLLALAVKSASLARIAGTLVETYLGRDAGRRVLSGRISRGVADRIEAVLWFSDLRGYTTITDVAPPEQIIPFLNDYSGAVITAIHEEGGDVLKLMGDGTLAIFTSDLPADACDAALAAFGAASRVIATLNEQRQARSEPTTVMYLGLHIGDVFYGNIGSKDRLDFTVVGPAVNEVSRIAAMCRSVDRPALVSSAFAQALRDSENRLVSVGRFALRGVSRAQTLYTLDPNENAPQSAMNPSR
jgi:adenylate cyclase